MRLWEHSVVVSPHHFPYHSLVLTPTVEYNSPWDSKSDKPLIDECRNCLCVRNPNRLGFHPSREIVSHCYEVFKPGIPWHMNHVQTNFSQQSTVHGRMKLLIYLPWLSFWNALQVFSNTSTSLYCPGHQ